jgi:hypothetical protein
MPFWWNALLALFVLTSAAQGIWFAWREQWDRAAYNMSLAVFLELVRVGG